MIMHTTATINVIRKIFSPPTLTMRVERVTPNPVMLMAETMTCAPASSIPIIRRPFEESMAAFFSSINVANRSEGFRMDVKGKVISAPTVP